MLRQITAILLLVAFGTHTFQGTVIVIDYYANTENFAKRCINKLRPSMQCNGKCLLMKKLREEEKKEQQSPERKVETKADCAYTKSFYITRPFSAARIAYPGRSTKSLLPGYKVGVFHPPSLS
jgi:molybdopterin/thiamine biosynthesis adenylyltransferase